jgi:predicted signal transduction protein with EAL and GGDEF domain
MCCAARSVVDLRFSEQKNAALLKAIPDGIFLIDGHGMIGHCFSQESYEFVVTPSIGIALYPEHGSDAQSLLKNADGAMYETKASGRNQLRVYDSSMNVRALKRLSLEMELRRAVDNSSLEVYYQPKYQTQGLKLLGGEALLRWFRPERGQIPTADFVAVAEGGAWKSRRLAV